MHKGGQGVQRIDVGLNIKFQVRAKKPRECTEDGFEILSLMLVPWSHLTTLQALGCTMGRLMDSSEYCYFLLPVQKRNMQKSGYARRTGESDWELSREAVRLIGLYRDTWPSVFEALANVRGSDRLKVDDLFPNDVCGHLRFLCACPLSFIATPAASARQG